MKRLNSRPADKRSFACPQCDRLTLLRPLDYTPKLEKQEYKTRDGSTVELFTDVCDKCQARNWRKHFEPSKSDLRRVLRSIHGDAELSEEESLEDLL